jgi:pyruvate,water dikinase
MKMINEKFLSWGDSFQAGTQWVGGKGWNLGKLYRYGFKIPVGGVLTTEAYKEFIAENELQESMEMVTAKITIENLEEKSTDDLLSQIRESIKTGNIPLPIEKELDLKLSNMGILNEPVAVRSSASAEDSHEAAFAGIHESFLNVIGMNKIMSAIRECYASLWTLKAITYRRKMNIRDNEVLPALVIMEMIDARASGIGFTCNPLTGQQDIIVINANFGLGESVVSGIVEPDQYFLDGSQKYALPKITEIKIGKKSGITANREDGGTEFVKTDGLAEKRVLPDQDLIKLGLLILRVYESVGCGTDHQDVEWVYDGTDFVFVQTRPVTVLPKCSFPEISKQAEIWSNGNYKDSLPMVLSTLVLPILKNLIETVTITPYKVIGYSTPPGLKHGKLFRGRLYANLSAVQWGWFDALGMMPDQTNAYWGGHQPKIEVNSQSPYKGKQGLKRIWNCCKMLLAEVMAKKRAPRFFTRVRTETENWRKKGFKQVEDGEFVNIYNDISNLLNECAHMLILLVASASSPNFISSSILEKLFPGRGISILNALMTGGARITSAQHGYQLTEMTEIARRDVDAGKFFSSQPFNPLVWDTVLPENSPFKQAFKSFLDEYGHRGVYEFDIINPRWREDPSYLLETIRGTIGALNLSEIKARQTEIRQQTWQEINEKVPFYWRIGMKYWVKQSLIGTECKEMARSVSILPFGTIRLMALEIGSRLQDRGIIHEQADIFHCSWPEVFSVLLGEWDGRELTTLINDRKMRRKELGAISPPDLIFGEIPQPVTTEIHAWDDTLSGLGVASGRASGTAKLIYHPNEGRKLQYGDVLVAPSTDPAWTPLFLKSSAIVMENGGLLSHGSIVAREYGIPTVVNVPEVMKIIKDGQKIVVDGTEGKVFLRG